MDNKTHILNCALTLFANKGYDAVGVQEIVDTAGITKPTLYHYFGSKRGLLDALVARESTSLFTAIGSSAVYNGNILMCLRGVASGYFKFALNNKEYYRLQLAMWFSGKNSETLEAIFPSLEQQHRMLEEIFIKASIDHGNMKGRHKLYSATFLGTINTYIGLALNSDLVLDDQLIYKAVHQFMHGIFS
ncbi:MAG: TetR/AcrR family transcriptional regulator [Ignavibacteria bacterium]|nr:TetR/AcrR family transcriptional regulator [Ignavibacteria bacterium]